MDCSHLSVQDGCAIIKQLANGHTFQPALQHCQFCSRMNPPCGVNQATIHLAARLLQSGKDDANLERLKKLELQLCEQRHSRLSALLSGDGVGSHLWRLLESLGIEHTTSCSCLPWAERLNAWGPKGCALARSEIVAHMKSSAKNYGWGDVAAAAIAALQSGLAWKLNPLDLYGSLLDEAIRLASNH